MKTISLRTRVTTGTVVAAAVSAVALGTVAANASTTPAAAAASSAAAPAKAGASAKNIVETKHLTIAAATQAAQASMDAATKANQHVSVAVVDRDGNTILTLRGDGAGPQSYDAAAKKAFTAVSWNAPTSELAKRLAQAPTLKDIPGTLFLAGGAPVTVDNAPIAGIGVAGAPSGDLDEQFAAAGVASLGK